jgi:hypothetical protein
MALPNNPKNRPTVGGGGIGHSRIGPTSRLRSAVQSVSARRRRDNRPRRTSSALRPVFLRRNRFRFTEFRSFPGRNSYFVSIDYDYRAQAQAAIRWAVAATCERERLEWVRIALAWHDLAPTCATLPDTEGVPPVSCAESGSDSDLSAKHLFTGAG